MKALKSVKEWLRDGCVYFAILALVMTALQFLVNGIEESANIRTLSFLLMLPCGMALAAGGKFLHSEKIAVPVRYLLHFVITVLSLFLFLFLPSTASIKGSTAIIMLAIISIFYWLVMGIVILIRHRLKKLMQED